MGRETIIQLWEHFKGFDEIWIIARRRERLDELDRQAGVPLRKFALDLTRERDRDVLSQALATVKPQVKFLVNAAGFGKIGRVEELGLKSETDMVVLNCEALCAVTRMVLPYMECNSRIIQYASSQRSCPSRICHLCGHKILCPQLQQSPESGAEKPENLCDGCVSGTGKYGVL